MATRDALLKVDDLRKTFVIKGSTATVSAVGGVSFEIGRGETLGLVGESGSGKTTVGRCVLRLVEPTAGRVVYQGVDVTTLEPRELRKLRTSMQMVFQEPHYALNPRYTTYDSISEPLKLRGVRSRAERDEKVKEIMQLVRLRPDKIEAYPHQISSGEQQRLSIARALACDPKLIVLDEPTSMLDLSVRAEIIDLLMDLQKRTGISYLLISHDLSTIKYICHRVAVMYLGEIVEIGTTEQIFDSPAHPYSRALLSSILVPDPEVRLPPYSLQGEIPSPVNLPSGCYLSTRCPLVAKRCVVTPQKLVGIDDGRQVRCWRAQADAS